MPVIDFHVHIGGLQTRKTGCFMSLPQKEKLRRELPQNLRWQLRIADWLGIIDGQIRKRLIQFINETKEIDYAVVLAMDGVYDGDGMLDWKKTSFYVPNDYVFTLARLCPKIIPAASINPLRRDAIDELERCSRLGARVIKWLPSSQIFDPLDKRLAPFYKKLAQLKMPLLSHTGYEHMMVSASSETQVFGEPRRLIPALELGVTVIMAHSGTSGGKDEPEYFDDFIELAKRYPHLYGDMAAFTHWTRARLLPQILAHPWIFERFIHGSDATLQPSLESFSGRVAPDTLNHLRNLKNPIRKDFLLKQALGFPKEVFTRGAGVLGIRGFEARAA